MTDWLAVVDAYLYTIGSVGVEGMVGDAGGVGAGRGQVVGIGFLAVLEIPPGHPRQQR